MVTARVEANTTTLTELNANITDHDLTIGTEEHTLHHIHRPLVIPWADFENSQTPQHVRIHRLVEVLSTHKVGQALWQDTLLQRLVEG